MTVKNTESVSSHAAATVGHTAAAVCSPAAATVEHTAAAVCSPAAATVEHTAAAAYSLAAATVEHRLLPYTNSMLQRKARFHVPHGTRI